MVYVIVEVEPEDLGDVANRLLGVNHRLEIVDDLSVACGCGGQPKAKRSKQLSEDPELRLDQLVASNPSLELPDAVHLVSPDDTNIVGNTGPFPGNNDTHANFSVTEIIKKEPDQMSISELVAAALSSLPAGYRNETPENGTALVAANGEIHGDFCLAEVVKSATNPSSPGPSVWKPDGECSSFKRNNGVAYNTLPFQRPARDPKQEENFPEGSNLAIKCAVCESVVSLGTRRPNFSTRKYAHARRHGFLNRFECSLCHELFQTKRVCTRHNNNVHGNDRAFRMIDRWNDEAQRDLIQMVKKCFPSDNKPFLKQTCDVEDEENANAEMSFVKEESADFTMAMNLIN